MSDHFAVTITSKECAELLPVQPDSRPLGPREIMGRTLASLISAGTELASAFTVEGAPRTSGYAAVFEVEEVGAEVKSIKPGDRALCMGPHRSFQRVSEPDLVPLPAGLDPREATFGRLMGVSMSTLVTTTARPPDQVVVMGLGLVGNLASQIFSSCGYRVTACDPVAQRREWAAQAGVPSVLAEPPLEDPALAGQVALVLECSGREDAAMAGCSLVRKRGEVVLIGTPWRRTSDRPVHEMTYAIFHRYVVIRSGWEWELPLHPSDFRSGSVYGNLAGAVRWLAEGRVRVSHLYTAVDPRQCQQAYEDLLHGRAERLAVVFDWESSRR